MESTTTAINWFKKVAYKRTVQLHPVRCGRPLRIDFVKLIQ